MEFSCSDDCIISFSHENYEYYEKKVDCSETTVSMGNILLEKKGLSGGEEEVSFAGGDGTEENPYQIETLEQLDAVRYFLDKHFIQIADIDMSDWGNWEPIGKAIARYSTTGKQPNAEEALFTGEYNGNSYKIKNLRITNIGDPYANGYECFGLFAGSRDSKITNVNLENIEVNIDRRFSNGYQSIWETEGIIYYTCVGGIVGICKDTNKKSTTIENCTVDGLIKVNSCADALVGGITGYGSASNCKNYASITVIGDNLTRYKYPSSSVSCGGIIGETDTVNSVISKCENNGTISATAGVFVYVGGISGKYGLISDCMNTGDVYGSFIHYGHTSTSFYNCNVGGINGATSSSYIMNCINYGDISAYDISDNNQNSQSGNGVSAGGISGANGSYGYGDLISCYNLCDLINAGQEKSKVGRIAGASIKITNCYSLNETLVNGETAISSLSTIDSWKYSINGANLSKDDFINEKTYIGFDFENTWKIDPEIGGAVLR